MNRRAFLSGASLLFSFAHGARAFAAGPVPPLPLTPDNLVKAARRQIGKTVIYDPAYVGMDYPGGDVPEERGVCADVIVRAWRACGVDLQKAVHEDMKAHFQQYPKKWGLKRTDRNIDHRRVLNLEVYFKRRGFALPPVKDPSAFKPGDLVTCTVPRNLPHIMLVTDRRTEGGIPFILHNIGQGAREEARLFEFPHTGHFRWR